MDNDRLQKQLNEQAEAIAATTQRRATNVSHTDFDWLLLMTKLTVPSLFILLAAAIAVPLTAASPNRLRQQAQSACETSPQPILLEHLETGLTVFICIGEPVPFFLQSTWTPSSNS